MKIQREGNATDIVAETLEEKLFTLLYHEQMREHVARHLRVRNRGDVENWLNLIFGAWKRRADPRIGMLRNTEPDWDRIRI